MWPPENRSYHTSLKHFRSLARVVAAIMLQGALFLSKLFHHFLMISQGSYNACHDARPQIVQGRFACFAEARSIVHARIVVQKGASATSRPKTSSLATQKLNPLACLGF